jgi:4-hydroxy-3-polyprenylbenzoate decarboxylase
MAVRRFVVGVTGASGSICARSVIRGLLDHPDVDRIHVILSRFSLLTINAELGASAHDEARALEALIERPRERGRGRTGSRAHSTRKLVLHNSGDMAAAISSGSHPVDGMVVVPCSGGTLAAIATGVSSNLIHRAAEVTLKERRPLVLAFRETPLGLVHIDNMRRATLAGSIVFPLTPAFYNHPLDLEEIVANFTGRIFDLLHLPHNLVRRWGGSR